MDVAEIINEAIAIYANIATIAVPFAMTFAIGNIIFSTFMKMAFGGRIEF